VHAQRVEVRPALDHDEPAVVLVHRVELAAGLGVHLRHGRQQCLPDGVDVLGQRSDGGDDDDGHGGPPGTAVSGLPGR
jgi:hypothetical protein